MVSAGWSERSKCLPRTSEGSIEHFDCSCHEGPALHANLRSVATVTDIVIVRHIDIEYELSLDGLKLGRIDLVMLLRLEGRVSVRAQPNGELSST